MSRKEWCARQWGPHLEEARYCRTSQSDTIAHGSGAVKLESGDKIKIGLTEFVFRLPSIVARRNLVLDLSVALRCVTVGYIAMHC